LTTESGSKQRFSSLQEKVVIHAVSPVLDLKGGLWVFRKCQKMTTASDQYFLSYVKKLRVGGLILVTSDFSKEEVLLDQILKYLDLILQIYFQISEDYKIRVLKLIKQFLTHVKILI